MGIAIIKVRLMPTSPDVDLEDIIEEAGSIITKNSGKLQNSTYEPIAFGLKALIITFTLSEDIELDPIEEQLSQIDDVNSCQVIDMRRAL